MFVYDYINAVGQRILNKYGFKIYDQSNNLNERVNKQILACVSLACYSSRLTVITLGKNNEM